jgi:type IV pilus assembly protein PilE
MTQKSQAGLTLVELVVVLLIISILASVAIPGYRNYILRANRTDAKTALLNTAAALERCFTQYRAYNSASCTVALSSESTNGKYDIDVEPDTATFLLTAAPKNGQERDTHCGSLTLDETNTRGATGADDDAAARECWAR